VAVAVAVRDHGIGFEANQAKQVFHRFWRADPARARTVGGTGLGLAIAMEDANLHGGWLTAWGRPGLGAQFRLTLPKRSGGLLEASPLPMVPRDLVGPIPSRAETFEPAAPPSVPPAPSGRRPRPDGGVVDEGGTVAPDRGDHRADRRAGGVCLRADRWAGRKGRGPTACLSELRQCGGRAAGAR
jgi:hypothetical protein